MTDDHIDLNLTVHPPTDDNLGGSVSFDEEALLGMSTSQLIKQLAANRGDDDLKFIKLEAENNALKIKNIELEARLRGASDNPCSVAEYLDKLAESATTDNARAIYECCALTAKEHCQGQSLHQILHSIDWELRGAMCWTFIGGQPEHALRAAEKAAEQLMKLTRVNGELKAKIKKMET